MVIYRVLFSFLAAFIGFRLAPLLYRVREFSGITSSEIVDWFFEPASALMLSVLWLFFGCGSYFMLKITDGRLLATGSLVFGLTYAVFDFPIAIMARYYPDMDYLGLIISYAMAITLILFMRHSNRNSA